MMTVICLKRNLLCGVSKKFHYIPLMTVKCLFLKDLLSGEKTSKSSRHTLAGNKYLFGCYMNKSGCRCVQYHRGLWGLVVCDWGIRCPPVQYHRGLWGLMMVVQIGGWRHAQLQSGFDSMFHLLLVVMSLSLKYATPPDIHLRSVIITVRHKLDQTLP